MNLEIEEMSVSQPTICLNMIVKNESRIITRLFDSVISLVDTYCICDTGSTDNTKAVIKEYFDTRCVTGKIFDEPFKNFGYNRNVAIKAAKGMADYLLFMDADMIMLISSKFNKTSLTEPAYSIQQGTNTFKYFNVRLVRSNLDINCVGATHEYYDHPTLPVQLRTITISDIGDGGCKGDKFQRDVGLLKEDLEENPNSGRTHFYLANSYKNLGKYSEAIEHYLRRIKIGGWVEEVWYSHYMIGQCYRDKGEVEMATYWWLKAYSFYPRRAESIYEIVKHFRTKGDHEVAHLFYKIGKEIPFPHDNVLFIHKDVYDYLFDYELSIISYYLRNYEGDKRDSFMKLFNTDHSLDTNHIMANYKFYSKSVDKYATKCLNLSEHLHKFPRNKSYVASTPSIIAYRGGYLLNIRHVNYHINGKGIYSYHDGYHVATNNMYAIMDKDFNVVEDGSWGNDHNFSKRIRGVEDIKIAESDGVVYFTGTCESDTKRPGSDYILTMVAGQYDLSKNKLEYGEIKSPLSRTCEKNWALFSLEGELKVIYEWEPLTIYTIKDNKLTQMERKTAPPFLKLLRGSTNGCLFEGEIWFICHAVEHAQPRSYYHCFVILDGKTMDYKRHSRFFTFDGEKIEFCLGLVVEKERIIVTHSNWDRDAKLKVLDKERLLSNIFG